jgi:O-antigen/teichoic acid export membrane protein
MPAKSRDARSRLALNSLFSLFAWFFPNILGFVATPILVKGLGNEQYGLFAIVLGFISYSFTFGSGKVVAKYIPEFQASGEQHKIAQVVSGTFWFNLAIGLIGSISLALFAPVIVADVLLIAPDSQSIAIHALYLAGAIGLVTMISQIFQFVLQGLHRFDNYVLLTNLNGLLLSAGNIVLVLSGYGVVALLLWNLSAISFTGLLFYLRSKSLLPESGLTFKVDREMFATVVRYGSNIILYQIFANVLFIFERSWVVRKFGAEALTFYFVPMLLAIYMHGLVGSFVQALFPVVNELLNNIPKLIRLYQKATKLIFAIVVFIVANYISGGRLFLTLWVSPELSANAYELLIIHSLTFGLIALCVIAWQLAEAFKRPELNVIMTGTWMLIAIPLMILAADHWKSEGIALSRLAAVLVTFPLIFYIEKTFLGRIFWGFWWSIIYKVGIATIVMVLLQSQIYGRFPSSYLTLFIGGLVGIAAFGVILLATGFLSVEEKTMIREMLARGRKAATE